ncbi:MAG: peptidylprolyl isomerase [Bacteroidetes bacterium]|nr:peptidylprolyl isomerase [Bacteroidota bacterium]
MAVIGRIRKRVGLLIGFVGASMVLFILGDLVTSNKGIMGKNNDVMGVVGGEKIRYPEFEKKVETLIENYKANTQKESVDQATTDQLREQAWSMELNNLILGKEYKKLGVSCGPEELYDMCTGKNVHEQIKTAFTNKQTNQFNPQDVVKFLKDLPNREEAIQKQWKSFEDAITDERIAQKYKDAIKGGIFATTAEAKANYEETGRMVSIKYIRMDYGSVPDSSIKVEDSDMRSYYNEHQNDFKQAETIRKVEYVTYDVKPSADDNKEGEEWLNKKKEEFTASTSDSLFVNQNSDAPFDSSYKGKGTLQPALDTLFNASLGTVVGPYFENGTYKLAKLTNTKMVSDSVKARHILIKIQNGDTAAAQSKADSLKSVIKKGQKFGDLAKKYSEDPGSAIKDGDLGWFKPGMMVPSFNDACFNGKKGDMPIVTSQFGIHLIEIMDKGASSKQVQIAVVEHKVEASQKTFDKIYQDAQKFASDNSTAVLFDSAIVKQGLNKRIADNLKEGDKNIAGLESPREMVRWAYKVEKGEVSKVFTFGDKYVIGKLTEIKEKGILPMEDVKDKVSAEALKLKKAEKLIEQFNTKTAGATTMDAIGQKLNLPVTPADNVTFSNPYLQGVGSEPRLVGIIFAMKAGLTSKAIRGENAVFAVSVEKVTEPAATKDYSANQKQIADQRKQRSEYEVFNALKEKANVVDNRGKFY